MLPAPVLPAPLVHALTAEARAEYAAELATAECERLARELAYARQTARRAATEAAQARRRRLEAESAAHVR